METGEDCDKVGGNEKLLLSQIEKQQQVIAELQRQLAQQSAEPSGEEHALYLHKRIQELSADSKRHFEKYRAIRQEHTRLVVELTQHGNGSKPLPTTKQATAAQKAFLTEAQTMVGVYEARLLEVTYKIILVDREGGTIICEQA